MKHQLRHEAKGKNGAVSCVLSDVVQNNQTKQIGKLEVRKGTLIWYDGYATGNNKYRVNWDSFIEFMKKHPAK